MDQWYQGKIILIDQDKTALVASHVHSGQGWPLPTEGLEGLSVMCLYILGQYENIMRIGEVSSIYVLQYTTVIQTIPPLDGEHGGMVWCNA